MVVPELAAHDNSDELVCALISRGAAIVGLADLGEIRHDLRMDLPVGVSIAVPIRPHIVAGIEKGPTSEYYAEYERLNSLLSSLGAFAADHIARLGRRAVTFTPTNVDYDPKTLSTRLPHKTVATRAGLGWIGKAALLVTESFGPAVRFTTVLTDAAFATGQPVNDSRCGNCRACVDVCPARAAADRLWHAGIERDSFFNAAACRKTARELSAKIGVDQSCCGVCIAACPWTQAYIRRNK